MPPKDEGKKFPHREFGQRLRGARRAAGLTLKQLAELVEIAGTDISPRSLEVYEAGVRLPRYALPAIAQVLHVSPHWLQTGEERIASMEDVVARLEALESVISRALDAAGENWAMNDQRLRAIEERLGALEQRMGRLEDLEEREALRLQPDDGQEASGSYPSSSSISLSPD